MSRSVAAFGSAESDRHFNAPLPRSDVPNRAFHLPNFLDQHSDCSQDQKAQLLVRGGFPRLPRAYVDRSREYKLAI